MAEKLQLEIEISPDGDVRIHTHGLKGSKCVEETDALEKALGKVLKREKTGEFYERAGVQGSVKRGRER